MSSILEKALTLETGAAIGELVATMGPPHSTIVGDLWTEIMAIISCVDMDLLSKSHYSMHYRGQGAQKALFVAALKNPAIGARKLLEVLSAWPEQEMRAWMGWVEALCARDLVSFQSPMGQRIERTLYETEKGLLETTTDSEALTYSQDQRILWLATQLSKMPDASTEVLDKIVYLCFHLSPGNAFSDRRQISSALWHHPNRSLSARSQAATQFRYGAWTKEDLICDGPNWGKPGEVETLLSNDVAHGIADLTLTAAARHLVHIKEKRNWERTSSAFRSSLVSILLTCINTRRTERGQPAALARMELEDLLETVTTYRGFLTDDVLLALTECSDSHIRQWALLRGISRSNGDAQTSAESTPGLVV